MFTTDQATAQAWVDRHRTFRDQRVTECSTCGNSGIERVCVIVPRRLWLLLLALSCVGCPERQGGASDNCAKRGEQCTLKPGVLGVCNDGPCPAGREPPCLVCTSQH